MSWGRRAICGTALALACGWLVARTAVADSPSPGTAAAENDTAAGPGLDSQPAVPSVERLLLLTPGEPLRLDLALELGGQPLVQAWRQRIDQLAAEMEQDEKGTFPIAAAVQVADLASGDFGLERSPAQIRHDLSRLAKQSPANAEGRIRRDVLIDYLLRTFPPFVVAAGSSPGSAAAPALFGLLDVDHDGRLSRAELAAAQRRLAVRDFDDDELISERELIVDPTLQQPGIDADTKKRLPAPECVIWLSPSLPADSASAAIVRRYDRDGDGRLSLAGSPRKSCCRRRLPRGSMPTATATWIRTNLSR